jgi:hypothetical protein
MNLLQNWAPLSQMIPFIENMLHQSQRNASQLVGATVVISIRPELMEIQSVSHRGSRAFFFILLSKNRLLFNRKLILP